jgi:hypothetical protein
MSYIHSHSFFLSNPELIDAVKICQAALPFLFLCPYKKGRGGVFLLFPRLGSTEAEQRQGDHPYHRKRKKEDATYCN